MNSRTGEQGRHHVHESLVQKAISQAVTFPDGWTRVGKFSDLIPWPIRRTRARFQRDAHPSDQLLARVIKLYGPAISKAIVVGSDAYFEELHARTHCYYERHWMRVGA